MGSKQPIKKKSLKINRQSGTNAVWLSWSLDKKVLKKKISKTVYKQDKNGKWTKKKVDKKYNQALSGFVVEFLYSTSTSKGKYYLDNTIAVGKKTYNTSSSLWTPPDSAIAIQIKIKARSAYYQSGKKSTDPWFKAAKLSISDKDYEEIPGPPSIGDFKIEDVNGVDRATVLATYPTSNTGGPNMTNGVVHFQILSSSTKVLYLKYSSSNVLVVDPNSTSESYGYYFKSTDTSVVANHTYYTYNSTKKTYTEVKNPTGNPSQKNYYQKGVTTRIISADNTVGQTQFIFNVPIPGSYQVRARIGVKDNNSYRYSEWSAWSSQIDSRPQPPTEFNVYTYGANQIQAKWTSVSNVTQYDIEYVADKEEYFDSSMISSVTVNNATSYIIPNLEVGSVYFFRIRSVKSSNKSVPRLPTSNYPIGLALKPDPPTTWSSKTVATITNDPLSTSPLYIYWTHNPKDGSAQRSAITEFTIAGTSYFYYKENTEYDDFGELKDEITEVNVWDTEVYTDDTFTTSAGTIHSIFLNESAETIKWKVKTKGVGDDYSDYSVERTLEIFVQPTLELSVTGGINDEPLADDILTSFPLHIVGSTTPNTQTPISYHINIRAGTAYDTTDIHGDSMTVNSGDYIFTETFDSNEQLDMTLTASDIDFVSGIKYSLNAIVYMNSGLTAEATYDFTVEWEEIGTFPDAMILFDNDFYYADITPFATEYIGYIADDDTSIDSAAYIGTLITGELITPTVVSGSGVSLAVSGDVYLNSSTYMVYTCVTGGDPSVATWLYKHTFDFSSVETWYSGTIIGSQEEIDDRATYPNSGIVSAVVNDYYFNTDTGDIFNCVRAGDPEEALWSWLWNVFEAPSENTILSVYRKDANGKFVTIAENIDNSTQNGSGAVSIRDLHPNFGTVTYRIVSRNTETGALAFTDVQELQTHSSVVMQWNEQWNDEDEESADPPESSEPIYTGSILELPANIKLSDKSGNDVAIAEYIGRTRPVTYYGTQNGSAATINCEFPKEDTETLQKLRYLMVYMGDVYIREPSGLGYWATVSVSYNKNFKELTIPVTLEIRAVEGGM